MRRRIAFMPLALLALVAAVTVLALSTAEVSNSVTATISSTNSAALALEVADASVASISGGVLHLTFESQQPGSTYTYGGAFRIVNNTTATKAISIAAVTGESSPGVHLRLTQSGTGTVLWSSGSNGGVSVDVGAGINMLITIQVIVDSGATMVGTDLAVTVNGQ